MTHVIRRAVAGSLVVLTLLGGVAGQAAAGQEPAPAPKPKRVLLLSLPSEVFDEHVPEPALVVHHEDARGRPRGGRLLERISLGSVVP